MAAILERPHERSPTSNCPPIPPSDAERDRYLGPQRRWVPAASAVTSLLVAAAMWLLVIDRPWAWPLLIGLVISTVSGLLMAVTSSRRRVDSLAAHRAVVDGWSPSAWPSVDVLLPTAGEDIAVLRNTFSWVGLLRWGGSVRPMVLDDSGRPAVADLAAEFGFDYLVRADRPSLKKAGNLRHGFAMSQGEFVLVLDADFAPRSDLLFELIPYFDDPDVGVVQSPQYFDLGKSMSWVQLSAGATQVLFYRWTQPSWDRSGAAICVGTSAVYRRSAMLSIGGFPEVEHSEDIQTGVKLAAAGRRLRYVPSIVTKGLCPDSLDSFLAQQYRWCSGSMALMLDRGFHRIPMTVLQRLSYWAGFLYYVDTALTVFLSALPPIVIAMLAPDVVAASSFVVVLLALCARSALVPLVGDGRDSLVGLARIQTAYSLAHAVAIVDALRRRTGTWQPTGDGRRSATATRIRRLSVGWLVAVQLAMWGLIAVRVPEFGWWNYSLMAVFAALQLVISYPLIAGERLPASLDPMALRRRLPDYLRDPAS